MAIIGIDPKLQLAEEVANYFAFLLEENRIKIPKLSLPQILASKFRPGLDSDVTANSVISRFSEIGIPFGPLEGGHPNIMEAYTGVLISEVFDSIKNHMRVDVAVDPGIIITSAGANAGGPVASTGTNPDAATAAGAAV